MLDQEGEEIDELGHEIRCFGDTSPFPHLTQSAYEEFLISRQINEMGKGEKAKDSSPNRYNLRLKRNEGKADILDQPLVAERPAKPVACTSKERITQNISPIAKEPVLEVR
jgi:hypothetical protein